LKGSSCMKGNFHVQFLGGWGAAMLPGYPARLDSLATKGLAAYLMCAVAKVCQVLPGESRPRWKKAGKTIRLPSSERSEGTIACG
jgi:hypothetical protein